jgi:uncharacterized protein (TIGR03435 family)
MKRALLASVAFGAACLAQPASPPAFEVAAVRPMKIGDTGSHWRSGDGRLTMQNMSVRNIIQAAYGIKDAQFFGPSWLDNDRYSIEAKAETKVEDKQLMRMLQTLLADRFKLAVHREQKMVAGYALVVARSGLKIRPSEGQGSRSNGTADKLTATHLDMPRFARFLERVVGQPVIDETHVTGGFDFVLEYASERQPRADADSVPSALPSIFTALPEQLGLKLESRKVPFEMLIVDHAERPTEN